jgi:hypothetical protein
MKGGIVMKKEIKLSIEIEMAEEGVDLCGDNCKFVSHRENKCNLFNELLALSKTKGGLCKLTLFFRCRQCIQASAA